MTETSERKHTVTTFGIVGSGWRAEFYLRIAKALPERFAVSGLVTRNKERAESLESAFGIRTYRTLEHLLEQENQDFVVVSVEKSAVFQVTCALFDRGVAVLAETPPGATREELVALHERVVAGAKMQVAEQFHLQPMHAAGIALCRSGVIGEVSHAQISVNQTYHDLSLIRRYLGIGFENATVRGFQFATPGVAGPGRSGLGEKEEMRDATHVIALFDFDGKVGVFDFEQDQHRSWIRSRRVLVRGNRGELNNLEIRYLEDFRTPILTQLRRLSAGEDGNLEGYFLKGVQAGERWIYRNPFAPVPLSDEEIAIASCIDRMADYVRGGKGFYDLREAAQDVYLSGLIEQSIREGKEIRSETQPWVG